MEGTKLGYGGKSVLEQINEKRRGRKQKLDKKAFDFLKEHVLEKTIDKITT